MGESLGGFLQLLFVNGRDGKDNLADLVSAFLKSIPCEIKSQMSACAFVQVVTINVQCLSQFLFVLCVQCILLSIGKLQVSFISYIFCIPC